MHVLSRLSLHWTILAWGIISFSRIYLLKQWSHLGSFSCSSSLLAAQTWLVLSNRTAIPHLLVFLGRLLAPRRLLVLKRTGWNNRTGHGLWNSEMNATINDVTHECVRTHVGDITSNIASSLTLHGMIWKMCQLHAKGGDINVSSICNLLSSFNHKCYIYITRTHVPSRMNVIIIKQRSY